MRLERCWLRGYTGKLTMLDGKTGIPRTIVDIEKAAKLTVEETGSVPRFRKYRERGGSEAYSPEEAAQAGWRAKGEKR
jgi:hypothetical protein